MIDPEKLQLEARLAAIEYLLAKLLAAMAAARPVQDFDHLIEGYRAGLEKETIPGLDAAQSDLASSEIRDALMRLLGIAKEIRAKGQ